MRPYLSWIEGLTTNQYVGGSNPSGRTIFEFVKTLLMQGFLFKHQPVFVLQPLGVMFQKVCSPALFTVYIRWACGTRSKRFPNRIPQASHSLAFFDWMLMQTIPPLDHL